MLRGLAILMVMLMHSSCDLGLRCFTPLGGIGVSLFLLLSGYGLAESFKRKGLTDFWKNKFSKIWIPYIIVLIALTFIARSDVNWWQLLFEAVGINSRFWFVSFLLYNYLLFYVCYKSTRIYEYRYFLMGVFALCIFLFDNRIRAEQALSFMSGVFLSDYKNVITSKLANTKLLWLYQSVLLFVAVVALGTKQIPMVRLCMEQHSIIQNTIELMIKYPAALFLLSLCFQKVPKIKSLRVILDKNRFLVFCSTISFELYIIHFSLRSMIDKNHSFVTLTWFLVLSFCISWLLLKIKNLINSLLWKK